MSLSITKFSHLNAILIACLITFNYDKINHLNYLQFLKYGQDTDRIQIGHIQDTDMAQISFVSLSYLVLISHGAPIHKLPIHRGFWWKNLSKGTV